MPEFRQTTSDGTEFIIYHLFVDAVVVPSCVVLYRRLVRGWVFCSTGLAS